MHGKLWTKEEDQYLSRNYKEKTDKELARKLKRTPAAVKRRLSHLELSRNIYKPWNMKEILYLKENHKTKTVQEIAKDLNRTKKSVSSMMYDKGLKPKTENRTQTYILFKGDKTIAVGTSKEIAKQLGITVNAVLKYATPSYKRASKGKNRRMLAKLEEV